MRIRKILVPLDGSRFAEWALPFAAALATRHNAGLELVSVYEDEPTVGGWPLTPDDVQAWYERYLTETSDRIRRTTQLPVGRHIRAGPVSRAIEAAEQDTQTDLVVMATHGRGSLSRAWLGSVADHVARHGKAPVLLVRPEEDDPPSVESASLDTILIALDGSERAQQALAPALAVGGTGAAYRLVRVVPPHWVTSPYLPHAIRDTRELEELERTEAERGLEAIKARLKADGYCADVEVLVGVHPANGIVHAAKESSADLVVIASHGRRGFVKALLGSVADKVLRAAHWPVLLVRARSR